MQAQGARGLLLPEHNGAEIGFHCKDLCQTDATLYRHQYIRTFEFLCLSGTSSIFPWAFLYEHSFQFLSQTPFTKAKFAFTKAKLEALHVAKTLPCHYHVVLQPHLKILILLLKGFNFFLKQQVSLYLENASRMIKHQTSNRHYTGSGSWKSSDQVMKNWKATNLYGNLFIWENLPPPKHTHKPEAALLQKDCKRSILC